MLRIYIKTPNYQSSGEIGEFFLNNRPPDPCFTPFEMGNQDSDKGQEEGSQMRNLVSIEES